MAPCREVKRRQSLGTEMIRALDIEAPLFIDLFSESSLPVMA